MKFKNPFNRFFSKNQSTPESITPAGAEVSEVSEVAETPGAEATTSWDDLAKLNSDTSTTTFDDLAAVPFAGVASVTVESVTPESLAPSTGEDTAAEENISSIDSNRDVDESDHSELSPEDSSEASAEDEAAISPELRAFKNFFKTDLRIKRELMDAAPSPADDYDEASRMDYVDTAYRTFKDFRADFAGIARDFHLEGVASDATNAFFQRGAEHFAPGNYGSGITEKLYREEFTDLRPDFVEKVKDECVGYTFGGNLHALIEDSRTVNELLHAYHSYIMNSEGILQGVPAVVEKENDYGYNITLRGEDSALSRQVFDALPDDLDVGDTDIIGADEHVMMMVRDRGHALTIGAEPDSAKPDQIWVEYNIPKLCNVEMIKALPGLSGYTDNGARGGFFAARDSLGTAIADFIGKVPMDSDMSKPGGVIYERDHSS